MRKSFLIWINSLVRLSFTRFRQSLSDVRAERFPYMLIFSLAPLFINVQNRFLDSSFQLLRLDAMSWMGACYCVGAGILFAFASREKIHLYAKSYAAISLLFFSCWIFWRDPHAAHYFAFAFAFFFGGCAAIAFYFFTYALNRSERFLGASITILFAVVFQYLYGTIPLLQRAGRLYLAILVAATFLCSLFFRAEDAKPQKISGARGTNMGVQVGISLFFFFAHKTIEIFYTYTQEASSSSAMRLNGLVGLLVFFLALFLYFQSKYSLWHMCHLFFLSMLLANFFAMSVPAPAGPLLSRFFHAFELIGFIASYSLLGAVVSSQADFKLYKRVVIVTLNASFLLYIIPGILMFHHPKSILFYSAGVSFALFLVFLLLAPRYAVLLPSPGASRRLPLYEPSGSDRAPVNDSAAEDEAKDAGVEMDAAAGETAFASEEVDAAVKDAQVSDLIQSKFDRLIDEKRLTKRESEVIHALLQGYLYKQCADEMNISMDTVKFHARNAYKKLGVFGRGDLFSLFFKEQ